MCVCVFAWLFSETFLTVTCVYLCRTACSVLWQFSESITTEDKGTDDRELM